LEVDEAASRILGWSQEELLGHATRDFLDPADQLHALRSWLEMLAHPGSQRRHRLRHRHKDGSWVWLEVTNENRLADPDVGAVLVDMLDISGEMVAQEAQRAGEQLMRRLTEALPLGVVQIDRNRQVVYQNAWLEQILGAVPRTAADLLARVGSGDRLRADRAVENVLYRGLDADLEIEVRGRRRGDDRRCAVRLRALGAESGAVTGAIICVQDVTADVRLREELRERATFDRLTGLYNRAAILDLLAERLAAAADGLGTAVIFIDLDRFKEVNDEYGHAAGDELLRQVAQRLRSGSRGDDLTGRLGGDEFLLVCSGVRAPGQAMEIAARVAAELGRSAVDLGRCRVVPTGSVGVSWTPAGSGDTADDVIARADAAMYRSKAERQGRPVFVGAPAAAPTDEPGAGFGGS
jgi:diguanylate cyclase (GGDEF)-like protein/PAS domain S-box-containing protein